MGKNKKESNKLSIISICISVLALAVSIIFPSFNLHQNSNQADEITELNKMNFRPRFRIIEHEITKVWVENVAWEQFRQDDIIFDKDSNVTIQAPVDIGIKSKLKITNSGNVLGKLIADGARDTTVFEPVLRNEILSNTQKIKWDKMSTSIQKELLPEEQDTIEIEFEKSIGYMENHTIILHYILIYENEIGNLYDTYYWAEYKAKSFKIPNPFKVKNDSMIFTLPELTDIEKPGFLRIGDKKPSYQIYQSDEKKLIKNRIEFE